MMEAIKGLARRTTQRLKEKVFRIDANSEDLFIEEVSRKVTDMASRSQSISEKLSRSIRLLEDLGRTLKEIGEEHRQSPDLTAEARQLAEGVYEIGIKLVALTSEHRVGLQSNCIDLLAHFTKECAKLNNLEDLRRCNRLEYNFFKAKVNRLRENPPQDFTRVLRNEQALENWRIEFWRATENYKILCSQLYLKGRQSLDRSVNMMVQILKIFLESAFTGFCQLFSTSCLPEYPTNPILQPTPLPPNPLPASQPRVLGVGCSRPDGSHTLPLEEPASAAPHASALPQKGGVENVNTHADWALTDLKADSGVSLADANDASLDGSEWRIKFSA